MKILFTAFSKASRTSPDSKGTTQSPACSPTTRWTRSDWCTSGRSSSTTPTRPSSPRVRCADGSVRSFPTTSARRTRTATTMRTKTVTTRRPFRTCRAAAEARRRSCSRRTSNSSSSTGRFLTNARRSSCILSFVFLFRLFVSSFLFSFHFLFFFFSLPNFTSFHSCLHLLYQHCSLQEFRHCWIPFQANTLP